MSSATTARLVGTGQALSTSSECIWPLLPVSDAVSAIRRQVQARLAAWGFPPDTVDDAALVVSELATNVLVHARPPADVRLSWTWSEGRRRVVHIEVTDSGPVLRSRQHGHRLPFEEYGRGTGIVAALSARCGTRASAAGVTRWADLPAV
jgi:anti-sigma regulatory factor (Ser/Thr protein kinase)